MATRVFRVVVGAIAVMFLAACAASYVEDEGEAVELQSAPLKLRRECKDDLKDIYKRPNGDSGGALGDVVRCAKGRRIPTEEITQALSDRAFDGINIQKAVKLFRISYRTQRLAGQNDLATALVALPARRDSANKQGMPEEDDDDEDKMKDGKRAPLVVFAHGTAPYGTKCASSRLDPLLCRASEEGDTELLSIIAFATQGYAVVAPDYAGYVQGSRAPGYLLSEDEAHSVLDATRAMSKLRQKPVEKVVLVGHSQGGHAVLSAQALARTYGLAGQLVGVAAMAPYWAPTRLLGVAAAEGYPFEFNPYALAFIIEYFYTHAEVYDGPGRGELLFNQPPRDKVRDYVNTCSFSSASCNFINLPPAGFELAHQFFMQDFFTAVSNCGAHTDFCDDSDLAKTWAKRFRADRPKLDPKGAPVALWHGAADFIVPALLASCARDKIVSDLSGGNTAFTFCGDLDADHDQILSKDLAWVTGWINARALGGPEPVSERCLDYPTFQTATGISCPEFSEPVNVD